MALTPKDEPVRLGFGADDKVKIERTVVNRRSKARPASSPPSKTDEREFKITVRNGHDAPIRMAIEDQLPVSEIDDVKVEMLPGIDRADRARRARPPRRASPGISTLAPGEARDIKFGWRVRWPADKVDHVRAAPVVSAIRPAAAHARPVDDAPLSRRLMRADGISACATAVADRW